jgi:dTMP kinase
MTSKLGLFVTIEGGEGCGKTTLINRMAKEIEARGLEVIKTREPGGTPLGEVMREWVLKKDPDINVGHRAELFLYLTARAQHVEELILPAIESGKVVLCDRFNDSSVAYQGYGRGIDPQEVRDVCLKATSGLEPGLTFFVDVDPKVGLDRSKSLAKEYASEGEGDRIEEEKISFHQRVRDGFRKIVAANPDRCHEIDGSVSLEEVFAAVWTKVEEKLEQLELL